MRIELALGCGKAATMLKITRIVTVAGGSFWRGCLTVGSSFL
jgi:hypothetical protein